MYTTLTPVIELFHKKNKQGGGGRGELRVEFPWVN